MKKMIMSALFIGLFLVTVSTVEAGPFGCARNGRQFRPVRNLLRGAARVASVVAPGNRVNGAANNCN
jgi:hypothetical protein